MNRDYEPVWMDGDNLEYQVDPSVPSYTYVYDWKETDGSRLIRNDSYLLPFIGHLKERSSYYKLKKGWLETACTKEELYHRYKYLGFTKTSGSIIYREWAPNAVRLALVGPFNNWNENVRRGCMTFSLSKASLSYSSLTLFLHPDRSTWVKRIKMASLQSSSWIPLMVNLSSTLERK
jgi:hypothetical protein